MQSTYGTTFNIPSTVLGNTYYTLQENATELSKIEEYLKANDVNAFENFSIYRAGKIIEKESAESERLIGDVLKANPVSSESFHLLAKINLAANNTATADSLIMTALQIADNQKERQWKINELIETKNKINLKK